MPMRRIGRPLALITLAAASVAGCGWEHDATDSVSRRFGSDQFAAGGILNLTEPVAGDAFLAGGQVAIATQVEGDLVAAGGEVSVGGNIGDDVYAAGGTVSLDAIVSGNARIAGGDVTVGPATVIAGAASLTGGQVRFDGNTHEYLQVSAASVHLNGVVHGDVELRSGDLRIGPETRIGGRLVYHGPSQPSVPPGAEISGGIEFHESDVDLSFDPPGDGLHDAARGVGSFFWFLGVFIAAAAFNLVAPGFSQRAAQFVGSDPLKSLGLGFAVLVCAPVLVILLLITVIGIPVGLILLTAYLLLLFLGWLTTATFIGQKIRGVFGANRAATTGWRLLALLAALLLLWFAGRIPYVGHWIQLAVLLAGMGALVLAAWNRRGSQAPQPAA
jgi:cytoskeletal protein CcmA (bactofilin family)